MASHGDAQHTLRGLRFDGVEIRVRLVQDSINSLRSAPNEGVTPPLTRLRLISLLRVDL
jgi:hypothetical protein